MKLGYKAIVGFALLALLIQPLSAQSTNPIEIGSRLGLNMGNASLTPDVSAPASKSMRTGFAAGLYSEFGVAEGFAITAEALYNQGGYKITSGGSEATVKFDQILVPISGKYKFAIENSTVRPFIFGGGDVGFTAKAEYEAGGTSTDVKDSVESVDFGVHFGAGVEFEISSGVDLFFDGRFGVGLKDIVKNSAIEAKPWNIGILMGVSFRAN
jgi:opacity protein-like surface antigen